MSFTAWAFVVGTAFVVGVIDAVQRVPGWVSWLPCWISLIVANVYFGRNLVLWLRQRSWWERNT